MARKTIRKSNAAASSFSFMNRENIAAYVKVHEAQFQEYTQLYGIVVDYFSRNLDYYDRNGNIRNLMRDGKYNPDIKDFTYFTGPERHPFGIMMPIRFVVDYGTDNFMFAGFGMDTTNDAKIYITKKQFTNNCLEYFGHPKNKSVRFTKRYPLKDFRIVDTEELTFPFEVEEGLNYNVRIQLNRFEDLELGTMFDKCVVKGFELPTSAVHSEHSSVVDNNRFLEFDESSFLATIVKNRITKLGKGWVDVEFRFNISYNTFKTNYSPHWDTLDVVLNDEEPDKTIPLTFAPKVGDFVRIHMVDDPEVFRDYVITFVNDVNFSKDGISPMLTNFAWECNITRRKPSHEDFEIHDQDGNEVKVADMEKGLETILDKAEQEKVQDLNRETDVFDYDSEYDEQYGVLVDNIDKFKDGVFGSMNWVDNDEKFVHFPTKVVSYDFSNPTARLTNNVQGSRIENFKLIKGRVKFDENNGLFINMSRQTYVLSNMSMIGLWWSVAFDLTLPENCDSKNIIFGLNDNLALVCNENGNIGLSHNKSGSVAWSGIEMFDSESYLGKKLSVRLISMGDTIVHLYLNSKEVFKGQYKLEMVSHAALSNVVIGNCKNPLTEDKLEYKFGAYVGTIYENVEVFKIESSDTLERVEQYFKIEK